ncbi:MAG TPA: hypothetical protein PLD30_07660 [Candidatus Competibacteraceae bacterium]|nr:hypothetical protein [Candidatus Competibacteraceae bacterium]
MISIKTPVRIQQFFIRIALDRFTSNDDACWRGVNPQEQALNLQRFIANQEYGGYLSVSKSIAVTKAFAIGMGGTTSRNAGWVYACFAEGGFHLPKQGAHGWVKYSEQEIAMPGMLDWDDRRKNLGAA